jgi:hypothetical protein
MTRHPPVAYGGCNIARQRAGETMAVIRRLWFVSVLALVVTGCSAAERVPLVAPPNATPTPLATESLASASITPKSTPKSTAKPKATPKPAAYYKPPGWDGYSDVNCLDFDTHAHAQSFFKGTGGTTSNDPYGLDRDHDGIACETLP